MADDLIIKIAADTSSLTSGMAEVKTSLEAITKVLTQFATSMSGFATVMGSLGAPLTNLNTQLSNLSSQQVSRTKDATSSILDEYKKQIAAINAARDAKKAENDAFAATKTPTVAAAFTKTADADLFKETQEKKIKAAEEYNRKNISALNEYAIKALQAEQDISLRILETQKGYQNAKLAAGAQFNAARLGIEIQLRRDLENIAQASLGKADKEAAVVALRQKNLSNQVDLYENYTNQIFKIEMDGKLRGLKEEERLARYSGDKIALIKVQAKKEEIQRIAALQAKAAKEGGLIKFDPGNIAQVNAALKQFETDYAGAIANIRKEVQGLAADQTKLAKAQDNEGALQSLNQLALRAAAVGAALSAAFGVAIKPAMELEKALAGVAAVSQVAATSSGMVALRDLAIDLGRQFLYSSGEIGNGMRTLAQAGFDVPEINAMTRDILNLATAAAMPLENAFNIASTTLRAFSMEATDMVKVSNTLAATANMTNVEVQDLAESFKYIGPVAAAANVAFEDVSAALGIMGNAGIKGSMGGTALRQSISALIAPTSQQRSMIRELGLEVENAEGNFVGFGDIVRQMEGIFTTSITNPAQQAGIAMKLFGDRAGPGMLAVIKAGHTAFSGLAKDLKDSANASTEGGAAAETAANRMKNLTDQMALFGKATSGLATTILYPMLNTLGKIVSVTNEWINSITDFFKANEWAAILVTTLASLAGILGLVLTAVGSVTLAFTGMGLAIAANAKHGIKWISLLTFGLKGAGAAAAGAQLPLAGMAAATTGVGIAGRVAMGAFGWIGIALSALTIFGPMVWKLIQDFRGVKDASADLNKEGRGLFKEQLENTKQLNKEYQRNVELAQELIDTATDGDEIRPATRLEATIRNLAPAPLKKTGRKIEDDETGKMIDETVPLTAKEIEDSILKIRQTMMDIRAESEGLNANEDLTTEEYILQKQELDQIFNTVRLIGELRLQTQDKIINDLKIEKDLLENQFNEERDKAQGNTPTPESLEGGVWIMSPKEQASWLARIDAADKQLTKAVALKKELLAIQQVATNDIKMPFVRDLEGLGNLLQQANKEYAYRNKLKEEELAIDRSLLESTDTQLTLEEKQFAFNQKFIKIKIDGAKAELKNLKLIQAEATEIFNKRTAEREARAISQVSAKKKATGQETENLSPSIDPGAYDTEKLKREADAIRVAATTSIEAIRSQYGAAIASVISTMNQARSSISSLSIDLINQKQRTYDQFLKIQELYLTKTMAMTRNEYNQKADFLRQETAAALNKDQRRKGLEAEAANAQNFSISEMTKVAALMDKMSSNELGNLAQNSITARKILEERRRNTQAVEAEGRKGNVSAALDILKNVDMATEQYERINQQIKANTEESLAGAVKVEAAMSSVLDGYRSELESAGVDWKLFIDGLAEYSKEKPALIAAQIEMTKVDADIAELNNKFDNAFKEPKEIKIKFNLVDTGAIVSEITNIVKAFKLNLDLPANYVEKRAAGGFISGAGSGDIIPAMLEPGEFVMRKASVRSFGAAFFAALNNMSSPRIPASLSRMSGSPRLAFAAGGLVPGSKAGAEKTYNLNLSVSGKKYPLMGRREVVTALAEQLRREGLTT